jgi:DNA-binding transcriptional regulator YhcF (GntR family)
MQLAEQLQLSLKVIRRASKELVDANIISIEESKKTRKDIKHKPNKVYFINHSDVWHLSAKSIEDVF